jgi:hypothetical protein
MQHSRLLQVRLGPVGPPGILAVVLEENIGLQPVCPPGLEPAEASKQDVRWAHRQVRLCSELGIQQGRSPFGSTARYGWKRVG